MLLTNSTQIITRQNIQILQIENAQASAEIALFGGHLLSYKPKRDNNERLWVSDQAIFDGKKAIRGGVPVCWPWFGDHKDAQYSAHGYVRDQVWHIVRSQDHEQGTTITLKPNTTEGAGFDGKTDLALTVEVGDTLTLSLTTTNIGEQSLVFNCALHSYFAVTDICQTQLTGLSGTYLDKVRDFDSFDTPSEYKFTEETDRVHLCKAQDLTIEDKQQPISIGSKGHDSVVVWNPWQDKSESMGDMSDNGYANMLCVETAITQGQSLAPGEQHTLVQEIR